MKSRILFAALALALVFSSSALSQEQEMKKEAKKTMEHGICPASIFTREAAG